MLPLKLETRDVSKRLYSRESNRLDPVMSNMKIIIPIMSKPPTPHIAKNVV